MTKGLNIGNVKKGIESVNFDARIPLCYKRAVVKGGIKDCPKRQHFVQRPPTPFLM